MWHVKVPMLGVKTELLLLAHARAKAMPDLAALQSAPQLMQHQIPNPLSGSRDRTHNLMVPSQIHFHCSMMGTPIYSFEISFHEGLLQNIEYSFLGYIVCPFTY